MFNLIVTILALVLMIGAAIAGLTYLGPAFTNSQTKATVAAMLNAGEQFQGAEALYKSDNGGVYSLNASADSLTPYYLSSTPVVPSAFAKTGVWTITSADASHATLSLSMADSPAAAAAVCALIAGEVGPNGPYGCTGTGATAAFNFNL